MEGEKVLGHSQDLGCTQFSLSLFAFNFLRTGVCSLALETKGTGCFRYTRNHVSAFAVWSYLLIEASALIHKYGMLHLTSEELTNIVIYEYEEMWKSQDFLKTLL